MMIAVELKSTTGELEILTIIGVCILIKFELTTPFAFFRVANFTWRPPGDPTYLIYTGLRGWRAEHAFFNDPVWCGRWRWIPLRILHFMTLFLRMWKSA